jgi:hypothetical protein
MNLAGSSGVPGQPVQLGPMMMSTVLNLYNDFSGFKHQMLHMNTQLVSMWCAGWRVLIVDVCPRADACMCLLACRL